MTIPRLVMFLLESTANAFEATAEPTVVPSSRFSSAVVEVTSTPSMERIVTFTPGAVNWSVIGL